jgi:dihydroxy-acid dehydratase
MTCTGKTVKENLKDVPSVDEHSVIRPISKPISATGTIRILKGNIAPEGGVVKVAGVRNLRLEGPLAFSNAKKMRWRRFSKARSRPATSW